MTRPDGFFHAVHDAQLLPFHNTELWGSVGAAGETVILLSPNGAGKTTLFSLNRSIAINGRDYKSNRTMALALVGVMFQVQTLDLDLTAAQSFMCFCGLRGISRTQSKVRIEQALEDMGMAQLRGEKFRSLNGGHRRRGGDCPRQFD